MKRKIHGYLTLYAKHPVITDLSEEMKFNCHGNHGVLPWKL
ncbi:hypothetical protein [Winogradskyella tangerina]|nr:hypothetical protein [Winogradskyella tangerina]